MAIVCEECGAENPEEEDYCEVCDKRLRKPLKLFRKKTPEKEEDGEAAAERRAPARRAHPAAAPLSAAEEIRDIEVSNLSERDSRNALMRIARALEATGAASGEQTEVQELDPDTASVVEAIDSKLMELEVRFPRAPDLLRASVLLGNVYFNSGDLVRAQGFYEKAAARDPAYADALLRVVAAHYALGAFDASLAAADRLLALQPQDHRALYYKALCLKARNRLSEAAEALGTAARIARDDEEVWLLRAEVFEAMGDVAKAANTLNAGLSAVPSSSKLLGRKCESLIQQGRASEALEQLESALRRTTTPELLALRGKVLMAAGSLEDAEGAFSQALDSDAECVAAQVGMAALLALKGEVESADEYLGLALDIDPSNAEALSSRALLFSKQGKLKDALEWADRAIEAHPTDLNAWKTKADILSARGLHEEAIAIYEKMVALNPGNASAYHSMGVAHRESSNAARALELFQRAVRLAPTYAPALLDLGNALLSAGKVDDAIPHLRKFADLRPRDSPSIAKIAESLKARGRTDEAAKFYKALERAGASVDALKAQVDIARESGDLRAALQHLERLFEADPRTEYLVEMARLYLKSGDRNAAEAALSEAAEMSPDAAEVHVLRGDLLLEKKKHADALESYLTAISCDARLVEAYRGAVKCARASKDYELTLDLATKGLDLEPASTLFAESKALALSSLGRADEALDSYLLAAKSSRDPQLLIGAGRMALEHSRLPEAEALLGRALDSVPHDPDANELYALVLFRGRRTQAAEDQLRKALVMRGNAELHAALGTILLDRGDEKEAGEEFDSALALDATCAAAIQGKARLLRQLGRESEAFEHLRKLLASGALDADGLLDVTVLALDCGAPQEASSALERLKAFDLTSGQKLRASYASGRLSEARGDVERALRLYGLATDSLDALLRSARIHQTRAELPKSLELVERALKLRPDSLDALWLRAELLEGLGQLEAALQSYDRLARMLSSDAEPRRRKARIAESLSRDEEAATLLGQVVALDPRDSSSASKRLALLRNLGRIDEAIAAADEMSRLDPTEPRHFVEAGELLLATGRPQDALSRFEAALRLRAEDEEATLGRARSLAALGRSQEADAVLTALTASRPSARAFEVRADILAGSGRTQLALESYQRAIQIEERPEVLLKYSRLLLAQGDPARAAEASLRATSGARGDMLGEAWLLRGRALAAQGLAKEAHVAFKSACSALPRSVEAHVALASTCRAQGLYLEAIAALDSAIRASPEDAGLLREKARVALEARRIPLAQEALGRLLRLDPENLDGMRLMAESHLIAGEPARALLYAEKALGISGSKDLRSMVLRVRALEMSGEHDAALAAANEAVEATRGAHEARVARGRASVVAGNAKARAAGAKPSPPEEPPREGQELVAAGLEELRDAVARAKAALAAPAADEKSRAKPAERARPDLIALKELVHCLALVDRYDEAWESLAAAGDSDDVEALRARVAEARGRLQEAWAATERLLPRREDPENLARASRLLLAMGRGSEALSFADRGLEIDPGSDEMLVLRGHALLAEKRPKEALRSFEKALRIKASNAAALAGTGAALLQSGKASEAAGRLERAVEILDRQQRREDAARARIDFSSALRSLGQHERALRTVKELLDSMPGRPDLWDAFDECAAALRKPRESVELYRREAARRTGDPAVWVRLAKALSSAGDHVEAMRAAARSVEIAPTDLAVVRSAADRARDAADPAQEARFLEQAASLAPEDATIQRRHASALLSAGRPEDALAAVDRGLKTRGDSPELWETRGEILLESGRLPEASDSLDRALGHDASRGRAWALLGRAFFCAGREAEARRALDRSLLLSPNEPDALLGIAELFIAERRYPEASRYLGHVREVSPRVSYDRAVALLGQGKAREALVEIDRAIAMRPDDPALALVKGEAFRAASEGARAADELARAREIGAGAKAVARQVLALAAAGETAEAVEALRASGAEAADEEVELASAAVQFEEAKRARSAGDAASAEKALASAIEALRRASARDPSWTSLSEAKGALALELGRLEEASESFDSALRVKQTGAAWLGKGEALLGMTLPDAARRDLARATSMSPADPRAWYLRGIAEQRSGDLDSAKESFRKVIRLMPGAPWGHASLAYAEARAGSLESSLSSLDRAMTTAPRDPNVHLQKGAVLLAARRFGDAIRSFDSVLRLDRASKEAWNGRGVALTYLGRTEEALKCFEQVSNLGDQRLASYNSGVAYAHASRFREAAESFERSLAFGRDEEAEMNRQHALAEARRVADEG
jgi:tetratricopeptide (TPR) repeat protein